MKVSSTNKNLLGLYHASQRMSSTGHPDIKKIMDELYVYKKEGFGLVEESIRVAYDIIGPSFTSFANYNFINAKTSNEVWLFFDVFVKHFIDSQYSSDHICRAGNIELLSKFAPSRAPANPLPADAVLSNYLIKTEISFDDAMRVILSGKNGLGNLLLGLNYLYGRDLTSKASVSTAAAVVVKHH